MLTRKPLDSGVTNEAFAAVWHADNDRALALLHNVDAPGCAVMRARVWLRLERFERVLAEYDRRPLAAYQAAEATGLACCAAVAYASLGDAELARETLAPAGAIAKRSSDPLLKLHCAFTAALLALLAGEVERSRAAIAALSASAASAAEVETRMPYQFELAHLRARIFQHEGRHCELDNDAPAAELCFLKALVAAEKARRRDRFLEAQLLALLSGSISESPALQSREHVLKRATGTSWSPHLELSEAYVRQALLNNQRLFGSSEGIEALRARTAPSLAARLDDRVQALLLEDWPDRSAFYDECRFAVSLALDINWRETAEHEVLYLASLSVLLAPFEPTLPREIALGYEARILQLSPNCATLRDPARLLFETFRDACLAKADERFALAVDLFGRAAEAWKGRGLVWRAAIAGLERYGMTSDERDLQAARAFARAYPASSFSRRLQRALEAATARSCAFPYLGLYRATVSAR